MDTFMRVAIRSARPGAESGCRVVRLVLRVSLPAAMTQPVRMHNLLRFPPAEKRRFVPAGASPGGRGREREYTIFRQPSDPRTYPRC